MANAGYTASLNKAALDGQIGEILAGLDEYFGRVEAMHAYLLATIDSVLLAAPFAYAQADIDRFKAAFSRLDVLRQVYQGEVAQGATPEDFRADAKFLWGTGADR